MLGVLVWAGVCFILFLIYDFIRDYNKPCRSWSAVPFFGDLIPVLWNWRRLQDYIMESFDKFPEATTTFTKRPGTRSWLIQDPVNVEYVLHGNYKNYLIGPMRSERFHDFLGHGIFTADGDLWKLQRKTASYEFSNQRFREWYLSKFIDHTNHLLDSLIPDQTTDMQVKFSEVTLGSIVNIAFGLDIHEELSANDREKFANGFNTSTRLVPLRFVCPNFIWKTIRALGLPPERELGKALQEVRKLVRLVVHQRRKLTSEQISDHLDLLSRFMVVNQHSQDPYLKSDAFLEDMVMSMLLAGRDTTSNCLSWLFYELSRNPDVERKVIQEITDVVGDNNPSFDQLKRLPYLHAVMTETLRLWPSVPIDPKMCVSDDVLPTGQHIKKGETIELMVMASGRNPTYWEEPKKFKPERFLNEDGEFVKPSPYKAMFFQAGPRQCLGMDMAYLEVKTVVCLILQKYRLRLAPEAVIKPAMDITLPMVNGLPMKVVPWELG